MKKIFILFLLIIASCGYQPIYKIDQNIDSLKIKEINLTGDKTLGEKISKGLSLKIIKNDVTLNKLKIDSQINITETSKNSKGQVTSYRTTISTVISIIDNDNKFKLKQYQEEIENNLINQIIRDIKIFLNF